MKGFLEYSPGSTVLHTTNPLTKLILAFFLCVACFVSSNHYFILAVIGLNIALGAVAGVPQKVLAMLKTMIKLGLILFIVQLLITRSGHVFLELPFGLLITDRGLSFSLLLVLRLIGATIPLALMLSLTKMSDLSNVFVDRLKIPYQYAFAFTTALRFIPVFTGEMHDIMEAQTARGVEFDTRNPFKKIMLVLPLCVPLLISSVKRIDGAAISAELRGFTIRGKKKGYKTFSFSGADFGILALAVLVLTYGIVLG